MNEPVLSMKMMEERYELENRLLEAVHHGNEKLALQALQDFGGFTVPLRDQEHISLSVQYRLVGLNALFRKEVEAEDVHPLYIDKLSNEIQFRIQEIQTEKGCQKLVIDMIKAYCDLVKNYSLAGHSPVIRNVIRYARTHLNEDLSLRSLAERFNINRTYLSTLFHQEMGTTLTDYINELRIEYATELLCNNHFSIAAVCTEVGFSDVSYFTRVFKKVMGQTPAQYIKNCNE
ncbi:MAG: helix-turn-helix transcriptional regulator [Roseburia sp.]|nr:helix-turn-helix transcriptional regulator [Roseburia sp.]